MLRNQLGRPVGVLLIALARYLERIAHDAKHDIDSVWRLQKSRIPLPFLMTATTCDLQVPGPVVVISLRTCGHHAHLVPPDCTSRRRLRRSDYGIAYPT